MCSTKNLKIHFTKSKNSFFKTCPFEDIWVRIAPQCPTWRLNGVVLHVGQQKTRPPVIAGWYGTIKIPSVSKVIQVSAKRRPKFCIPWRLHMNLLIPSGRWTKFNQFFFIQNYCIMNKQWCVQTSAIDYYW